MFRHWDTDANREFNIVVARPKFLGILVKSENIFYNLKYMMRSSPHSSNKESPHYREEGATELKVIDLELDSLSLPEATRAYIDRRRQEVLEKLTGKDYAELFANAVASNLAEKALATSRLDPRDERQHLR